MTATTATTREAADLAGVHISTVGTWCRVGAVAAVKVGRRWAVDTASLARRIALGIRRTKPAAPAKPARPTLTVENVRAIGGREWSRGSEHRVYLNEDVWTDLIGLTKHGLAGRGLATDRAAALRYKINNVWFDANTGDLVVDHCAARNVVVRYKGGDYDEIDLVALIRTAVRDAVAEL
ncbi:hypothetical protein ACFRCG_40020 [Embleya sp. NPDC056575]|uniref:hypothetical protein n=1 Tax=unclassified Embleya TaxID=2699296 RepID=UPI0036CBFA7E